MNLLNNLFWIIFNPKKLWTAALRMAFLIIRFRSCFMQIYTIIEHICRHFSWLVELINPMIGSLTFLKFLNLLLASMADLFF